MTKENKPRVLGQESSGLPELVSDQARNSDSDPFLSADRADFGTTPSDNASPDQSKLDRLKQIAFDASVDSDTRAEALFKLGRHYFFAENPNLAFSYYSKGNDLMPYVNRDSRLAVPDWQKITQINKLFLATIPNWPHKQTNQCAPCPAVIVAGLPRSGKTLTELLLSRLPGVVAGGELALTRKFVSHHEATNTSLETLAQTLIENKTSNLAAQYQAAIEKSIKPTARIISDTAPTNIYKLGLFSLAYPNTPIIFCERDFLDLGLAIYFKKFRRGHFYSYNQTTLGTTIAVVEGLIDHWQHVLPNPILRIRYEDLVMNPRNAVDALAQFMQIPLTASEKEQLFSDLFEPENHSIFHPSLGNKELKSLLPQMIGFAKKYEHDLGTMKLSYAITRKLIQ